MSDVGDSEKQQLKADLEAADKRQHRKAPRKQARSRPKTAQSAQSVGPEMVGPESIDPEPGASGSPLPEANMEAAESAVDLDDIFLDLRAEGNAADDGGEAEKTTDEPSSMAGASDADADAIHARLVIRLTRQLDFDPDNYNLILLPYGRENIVAEFRNHALFDDPGLFTEVFEATNKLEAPFGLLPDRRLIMVKGATSAEHFRPALERTIQSVATPGSEPFRIYDGLDYTSLGAFPLQQHIEEVVNALSAAEGSFRFDICVTAPSAKALEDALPAPTNDPSSPFHTDNLAIIGPDGERLWGPSGDRPVPPQGDTRSHFLADHATDHDLLGYLPYAMGIASFVRDRHTRLPLTIAIDGAWGKGKSSLMKMLRNELDPDRPDEDVIKPRPGWLRAQWSTLKRTAATLLPLGRVLRGIGTSADQLGTVLAALIAKPKPQTGKEPDRKFVTVFVNAWRHGHGTQLKATLVNQILKSLTARLGPDFLMSLNLNRIDRLGLLNSAVKGFLTNSTTLFLALSATIVLLLSGLFGFNIPFVSWDMLGLSADLKALVHAQPHLPGGASAGMGLLLYLWKKMPAPDLKQYLQEPDYLTLMGDGAQVEDDFRRILEVLKERDIHLALFVDDLDRCSPADCAAVVEALNTFFGQEKHECLFVLGMHREMVATALEVAYSDLVAKIDTVPTLQEQSPFGRRFLEKIVQFVVSLPEPGEEATNEYLNALTEGRRRATLEEIRALQKVESDLREVATDTRRETMRKAGEFVTGMLPWPLSRTMNVTVDTLIMGMETKGIDIEQAKEDAKEITKLEEEIEERKQANENEYVAAFKEVKAVIRANPRQYKRFFNKLRFYRLLNVAEANPMLVDAAEAVLALEHPELHEQATKKVGSFHKLAKEARDGVLSADGQALLAALDMEIGVKDLREKIALL